MTGIDTAPVLEARALSVSRGRDVVVHDVDLVVQPGEVVALLGPNGAGKSTLLECLGGVIAPTSGEVVRRGRTATVLQTPGLARRTVRANVELALSWWGVPRAERRARAETALEQMRADHLASRSSSALSGGERRRVHVARGIACRPDLLLLDEPFAGLDGETHQALVEDTSSALRQGGDHRGDHRGDRGGVVVVVHDRADAWALADRVVVLFDGRVAADGPPADLLAAPPTPEVARFLGYDGSVGRTGGRLLTRPSHVRVDPDGELAGRVVRSIGTEDGALLEVEVPGGSLRVRDDVRRAVGDDVRLALRGGVLFPDSTDASP